MSPDKRPSEMSNCAGWAEETIKGMYHGEGGGRLGLRLSCGARSSLLLVPSAPIRRERPSMYLIAPLLKRVMVHPRIIYTGLCPESVSFAPHAARGLDKHVAVPRHG